MIATVPRADTAMTTYGFGFVYYSLAVHAFPKAGGHLGLTELRCVGFDFELYRN